MGVESAIAKIKVLPSRIIDAVVAFAGTATPQVPRDRVHQACLEWRGDMEVYLLERLDAAEVLLNFPEKRLIVPGEIQSESLPFFFYTQLVLLPTELERVAPQFAEFLADVEREKDAKTARINLEFAMAVTTVVLMRVAVDNDVHRSGELIDAVSEDGVDVVWKQKPMLTLEQDLKSFTLIAAAIMHGELVPKRKVTVPLSLARH